MSIFSVLFSVSYVLCRFKWTDFVCHENNWAGGYALHATSLFEPL